MARHVFADCVSDWAFTTVTAGGIANVAQLSGGQEVTFWNARSGGTAYTDLLDESGSAVSSVLTSTGSDGRAIGTIPAVSGPDGVRVMWASVAGGPRLRMVAVDLGDEIGTHIGSTGNPHSTTLAQLGDVNLSGATTGSTLVRNAGGTWVPGTPSGGTGGGDLPNMLVVAASDSSYVGADYTCDGIADDVQIQAAINAVRANGGGTVLLTAGTFNLAARVQLLGFDDANVEQELYLRGAGPRNTRLSVGSGVSSGLHLSGSVRCHISDLGLEVTGASSGITATRSLVAAALHRSAWFSSIERVQVKGPWNGTHTGWGISLGSVFRTRLANIEIGGTGNGLRFLNETSEFNAGDCTVDRMFVEVLGTSAVAYSCESSAGNMNQIVFTTCHSIASPSYSGTVAWKFLGPGSTSHIRLINCNVEQFATTISIASGITDVRADFVHVTQRNGSTFASVAGYNNRVGCGLVYIEPSATVSVITDTGVYDAKPNIYQSIDVYADAGATANVTLGGYGVLRDSTADGGAGATIAAALKRKPSIARQRVTSLSDGATVATDASNGDVFRVTVAGDRTLGAPTNPTDGQRARWEITASGGSRTMTLASGAGGFVLATGLSITALAAGSTDTYDCVYSATANRWRVVSLSRHTT